MYSIRPATSADFPELAQIFLAGRIQAFHWCNPAIFHLSDFTTQTEGEAIHVAADFDGQPIGFISVWRQDSFIHHLFVDSGHQRRGVGTLLLESLHRWLPFPYSLKCLIDNIPARAFYLNSGWSDVSTGTDSLGRYALMKYNAE